MESFRRFKHLTSIGNMLCHDDVLEATKHRARNNLISFEKTT